MSVYFIQNDATKAVKIGFTSKSIKSRLQGLQTSSCSKLSLLFLDENANINDENILHLHYQKHRLSGEWFDKVILKDINSNDCLKNKIKELREKYKSRLERIEMITTIEKSKTTSYEHYLPSIRNKPETIQNIIDKYVKIHGSEENFIEYKLNNGGHTILAKEPELNNIDTIKGCIDCVRYYDEIVRLLEFTSSNIELINTIKIFSEQFVSLACFL